MQLSLCSAWLSLVKLSFVLLSLVKLSLVKLSLVKHSLVVVGGGWVFFSFIFHLVLLILGCILKLGLVPCLEVL